MPSPRALIRLGIVAALATALAPALAARAPDQPTRYVAGTFLVHGNPDRALLSGHAIKGDLQGYQLKMRLSESSDCNSAKGCAVYALHWSVTKDRDVLWGGCWKHRHPAICSAGWVDPNSGEVTLVGNVQGGVGSYADVSGGEVRLHGFLLPGSDVLPAVGDLRVALALRTQPVTSPKRH
jgi:hypothetical protein